MKIHVLGTGNAFSEVLGNTAFVVEHDGYCLAIDCPDRYREVLARHRAASGATLRIEDIDAWLISHLHADHCNGLEGVGFYRHFVERRRAMIVAPEGVARTFWSQRFASSMGQTRLPDGTWERHYCEEFFDVQVPPEDEEVELGPFRLAIRLTQHHLPATAVRLSAGGRTWANSSDTTFDPELIKFLRPADLIFHETGPGAGHCDYAALCGLPAELRAKMRLVHYADNFPEEPQRLRLARPGEIYDLATWVPDARTPH